MKKLRCEQCFIRTATCLVLVQKVIFQTLLYCLKKFEIIRTQFSANSFVASVCILLSCHRPFKLGMMNGSAGFMLRGVQPGPKSCNKKTTKANTSNKTFLFNSRKFKKIEQEFFFFFLGCNLCV